MDTTEVTKMIDSVYKNILDNFNPTSRQMIASGKAYLKSLHGASTACSVYLDSLVKLSRQAQQSSFGCSSDIGSSLMQVSEVFKEIHTQQLNTLKAFYVDFLVPLEANLEKDTRVIQNEQKKFLMCHKQKIENYSKAAANVKKMRKKTKKSNSATTYDKEVKIMQNLEEERGKLESFCEKSMKEALIQERRRYGFILERKASLAKHYLAFYYKGNNLVSPKLENWNKVAKSREVLPEQMQNALLKRLQGGGGGGSGEEDCIYCNPNKRPQQTIGPIILGKPCSLIAGPIPLTSVDDSSKSNTTLQKLRKTKSMDASEIINVTSEQDLPIGLASNCGGLSSAGGAGAGCSGGGGGTVNGNGTLCRAKSDLNLGTNNTTSAAACTQTTNTCCNGHLNGNGFNNGDLSDSSYNQDSPNLSNGHGQGHSQQQQQHNFHEGTATLMRHTQKGQGNCINGTGTMTRPKSLAIGTDMLANSGGTGNGNGHTNYGFVKARYAYLSSGENQLCFLEGDTIALIGERNNGWQYGENLRTQKSGWFPIAYTEMDANNSNQASCSNSSNEEGFCSLSPVPPPMPPALGAPPTGCGSFQQKRLNLADVLVHHHNRHGHGQINCSSSSGAKSLPTTPAGGLNGCGILKSPTVNTAAACGGQPGTSSGLLLPNGSTYINDGQQNGGGSNTPTTASTSTQTTNPNFLLPNNNSTIGTPASTAAISGRSASDSLHSSNDSGFSNDLTNAANSAQQQLQPGKILHMLPPPQPDIDYSDPDDEPQLINSEEFKSGDKWLMDKYHKSESIRLQNSNIIEQQQSKRALPCTINGPPRRSLSFGNISGSWDDTNTSGRPGIERIAGTLGADEEDVIRDLNSRQLYHHTQHGHHFPQLLNGGKEQISLAKIDHCGNPGALKKFINRTKSFIWKKGGKDEPEFDSVSAILSINDIWGSHDSLIDINYDGKGGHHGRAEFEKEFAANRGCNHEEKIMGKVEDSNSASAVPPPPPPLPLPRRETLPTPPPPPPAQNNCPKKFRNSSSNVIKQSKRPVTRNESLSGSEAPIIPTTINNSISRYRVGHTVSRRHRRLNSAGSGGSGHRKSQNGHAKSAAASSSASISVSRRYHHNNKRAGAGTTDDEEYAVETFDDEEELDTNLEDDDAVSNSVFMEDPIQSSKSVVVQAEQNSDRGSNSNSKRSHHYLVKSNSFRRKQQQGQHHQRHNSQNYGNNNISPKINNNGKKSQSMRISHSTITTSTTSTNGNMKSKQQQQHGQKNPDLRFRMVDSSTGHNGQSCQGPSSSSDIATLNNTIANTLHSDGVRPKMKIKGSIHSEFHTVELIATDDDDDCEYEECPTPSEIAAASETNNSKKGKGKSAEAVFDYSKQIHRRLYYPERSSRLDQKSERSGNLCGPWYDLWGCDSSVTFA